MMEKIAMKITRLMVVLGIWLVRKSGYHVQLICVHPNLFAAARIAVAEAERVGAGADDRGTFKRQAALQVLSNILPGTPEHDCVNAIQVVIEHLRSGGT